MGSVRDTPCKLLVVDDEKYILNTLSVSLQKEFELLTTGSADEAKQILETNDIHIILSDQRMPGTNGIQLLEWVREHHPKTIRILMTGYADLEDAVQAINRGHVFRYLFKPWRVEELQTVLREAAKAFKLERSHQLLLQEYRKLNEELEQRVRQRTLELEEANRDLQQKNFMLERLALTDELTGLPNRRAVDQLLQTEISRRARYPSGITVGYIDADHFKDINTKFHYTGGDQALIALARTLTHSVRNVDTVGRIGGEEFLVIAPQTDLEGARVLGERIRSAVERMVVEHDGNKIQLTVSVGLAVLEADCYLSPDQLWREAALALTDAKSQGRNCCVVRLLDDNHPFSNGSRLPVEAGSSVEGSVS